MGCWRMSGACSPYRSWRSCGYLDNTIDNPYLHIPTYVPGQWCHPCWGDVEYTTLHKLWEEFCSPAVRPQYPITTAQMTVDLARPPPDYTSDGNSNYVPPSGGEYYLDRGFAIACKFTPLSKCLPYIVFHYAKSLNEDVDIKIEIKPNDPVTNLPVGIPGDNNILGRVVHGFKNKVCCSQGQEWGCGQCSPYHYAVPINTILDEINVPVWIVIYSNDYACSNAYVGTAHRRLQLYKAHSSVVGNYVAKFSESTGCTWDIDYAINSIAFVTYKSTTCNGTVVINDYGFAKMEPSPIYLNDRCFVTLEEIQGSKVAIGVIYTNPDPVRTWKRVRFSFAYLKPDLRYLTGTAEILNVSPGQHETFFVMDDDYFTGAYDQLEISATVIQV